MGQVAGGEQSGGEPLHLAVNVPEAKGEGPLMADFLE